MRSKILKNQGSTILKYASTAQNPLDLNIVRAFEQGMPAVFLPFSTVAVSPSSTEAHYDITRLITLTEHLRALQGQAALRAVLSNFKQAIDACISLRLPLVNLELDSNLVYYDSWSDTLKFVYLPFAGIAADSRKIRGYFESLSGQVGSVDADMAAILNRYQAFFASSPLFNPIDFANFLGTVAGPPTQVDWVSIQANSAIRRADSDTTNLQSTGVDSSMIHARPASADLEGQSKPEGTVPEQGAHARVDPGTTVLGALSFDFDEEAFEGTEVLELVDAQPMHLNDEREADPDLLPAPPDAQPLVPVQGDLQPDGRDGEAVQPNHEQEPCRSYWLERRSTDERVQVMGDAFVVGKSKYSTYQVRHTTTVSRSHAIFTCDEQGCWIEDNGSRNGTYLDNRRIDPHVREKLEDGMTIRMSDEEFKFVVEG